MSPLEIILICVIAVLVIVIIGLIILINKKSDSNNDKDDDVSYYFDDFLLAQGQTYTAQKKGDLLPGKYRMVTGNEGITKFSVRTQGFVREYTSGDEIVLDEGDLITAVSSNVILK